MLGWWLAKWRLKSDEADVVADALRQVAQSGRPEAVDLAIEVHGRKDWLMKTAAARALGQLAAPVGVRVIAAGVEQARGALGRARHASFGYVRADAYVKTSIAALARIGGAASVECLVGILAAGLHGALAGEAIRAIGQDAIQPLANALAADHHEPNGELHAAAALAVIAKANPGLVPSAPGAVRAIVRLATYPRTARTAVDVLEALLTTTAAQLSPADLAAIMALPTTVEAMSLEKLDKGNQTVDCTALIEIARRMQSQ